ncbi:hypothetical protein BJ085DRAFT_11931, partial [Dimargaris cristalligena]
MSCRLFVGSLSWNTTQDHLYELFGQFGEVTQATVVQDRETQRSRGFGFVTYATHEAALEAIEKLNGYELDGRQIKVDFAAEQGVRTGGNRPYNNNGQRGRGSFRGGRGRG